MRAAATKPAGRKIAAWTSCSVAELQPRWPRAPGSAAGRPPARAEPTFPRENHVHEPSHVPSLCRTRRRPEEPRPDRADARRLWRRAGRPVDPGPRVLPRVADLVFEV